MGRALATCRPERHRDGIPRDRWKTDFYRQARRAKFAAWRSALTASNWQSVRRRTTNSGVIRIYELGKKEPVAEIAGMHFPKVWLNAETLVSSNESDVGVYDFAKKRWAARIKGVSGEFAVSPDGKKLAATGNGIRVRLWDLSTGEQLHAKR